MKRGILFIGTFICILLSAHLVDAQSIEKLDYQDPEGIYQKIIGDLHVVATDDSPFFVTDEEWHHAHGILSKAATEDSKTFNLMVHKMLRSHNIMNNYISEAFDLNLGQKYVEEIVTLFNAHLDEQNAADMVSNLSPAAIQDLSNALSAMPQEIQDSFMEKIGTGSKEKGQALLESGMEDNKY